MKIVTITFLVTPTTVWLAKKKKNTGADYYCGYGDKAEDNETIIQSAIREINDRSSVLVSPRDLRHMTVIDFYVEDTHLFCGHIFVATRWIGNPIETEEMGPPKEFSRSRPPTPMLPGDELWAPTVIMGSTIPLGGSIHYNSTRTCVIRSSIPEHHYVT